MENAERKFLHDIASPLSTATFSLEMVIEELRELSVLDPKTLEQLERTKRSLEKASELLVARRKTVQGEAL